MALVTKYTDLRKLDTGDGEFHTFHALRAVGLAVEKGHKVVKEKGLGSVTPGDVSSVTVSGKLQLKEGERWRGARTCTLRLAAADKDFAHELVRKQRNVLADLRINIWDVDVRMKGGAGAFDLLGDFSGAKNFGVVGKLWVELKVLDATSWASEVERARSSLETLLQRESAQNVNLGGVLFLAAKAERQGRAWKVLSFYGTLLVAGESAWQDLVGQVKRVARGQSSSKPPLAQVWQKMEWFTDAHGEEVGLLSHFLRAVRLCGMQPGERGPVFNEILQRARHAGRVREERIPNRAGRKPWIATRDTFRVVYTFV